MQRCYLLETTVLVVLLVDVVFSRNAYAYLDPGTGSILIQMVIGGTLAGAFAIKLFWRRIVDRFSKSQGAKGELESQGHENAK